MNNNFSESEQFYLDTCQRILDVGAEDDGESLSSIERIIFRANIFGCDVDNGGLSGFLYNITTSHDIAEDTAQALEVIGAPSKATLLRSVAAVVCRPEFAGHYETWGEYLDAVDPAGYLNHCNKEICRIKEDVFSLLEDYILLHRDDLTVPPSAASR